MVTITRSAHGTPGETARALEGVVQEVLAGAPEPLYVQFGTWVEEDGGTRFVCRVETPPATPFGATLQWRWWSPLFETPEQLREALTAAVQARRGTVVDDRAKVAPAANRSVA
jgi:hypothetical protein